MPGIVISYRRADSTAVAGRIADNLVRHFGRELVFMDIDSIPLGKNFFDHLKDTLERCDVVLAIIGPQWLRTVDGQSGMHDETDWVRLEIETALARKIPIIPVLIDDTRMPSKSALPEAMQNLTYYNAAALDTGIDFHHHVQRLIDALDQYVKRTGTSSGQGSQTSPASRPNEQQSEAKRLLAVRRTEVGLAMAASIAGIVAIVLGFGSGNDDVGQMLAVGGYLVTAVSIYVCNYVIGGLGTWTRPVVSVLFRVLARTIEAFCWLFGVFSFFPALAFLSGGTASSNEEILLAGSVVVALLTLVAGTYLFRNRWGWSSRLRARLFPNSSKSAPEQPDMSTRA